jgi:hypothetical protein
MSYTIPGFTPPPSGYSGPGSGAGQCPSGQHWDGQKCVDDVAVHVNQPDGHTYDIQTSPNKSGETWSTITTDDNATDAVADYNSYVADGAPWQILKDGVIWKTNLPEADRFKEGVQPGDLRDVWSIEGLINGTWTWLADANTLDDAKAKLAQVRAGTLATFSEMDDLRITDKNGKVVLTDKGKYSGDNKPGAGPSDAKGIILTLIALGVLVFVGWYLLQNYKSIGAPIKGAIHAKN